MFDRVHFLFACTKFIRIVNLPLRTAEGRMSYQAVRNDHPGRFKPGAVLNGSFSWRFRFDRRLSADKRST